LIDVSEVFKGIPIGKILIQRDETTAEKLPKLFYSRLPAGLPEAQVLLLDPMLASGGSAICAIQHLLERGVPQEKITFVNLISCPEGLRALFAAYPNIKVITSMIDLCLNEHKYIVPGTSVHVPINMIMILSSFDCKLTYRELMSHFFRHWRLWRSLLRNRLSSLPSRRLEPSGQIVFTFSCHQFFILCFVGPISVFFHSP
jgi:hypothetical protein